MLIPFEEYIQKANRAKTDEELVSVFLETVKQHGYDRMTFCLFNDHNHIGVKAGAHQLRNYPQDWMAYYFSKDFASIDPVIRYSYQAKETFEWKDIAYNMGGMTAEQQSILDMGAEAGLNNGLCAPLWSGGNFAGIGLASQERTDATHADLDLITAYCNHFYLAYQRLHAHKGPSDTKDANILLTSKEREVLLWVARGKTDGDIGDIMGISDHGVGFHLRNIYKKLDANSRILAVTKAICLGLIFP